MFYSDQITTTFGQFWYESDPLTTGTHVTSSADSSSSPWTSAGVENNGTGHNKRPESTTPLSSPHSSHAHDHNSTDYKNKTVEHHGHHHHHHQQQQHHSISQRHNSTLGNHSLGEEEVYYPRRNNTDSSETLDQSGEDSSEGNSSNSENMEGEDENVILQDFKERFAETMRTIVKRMENFTGIRRAEFVVPLFMLLCFLSFFSAISFCCCIMMRRRDNRRRKLFGKLITDLQTGDTKTVLLNHSDLDD
ncbi:unnamed protein product [Orchesella dallaii]|uniref:Uncharacterized protein n=1 Tax=Orchesella dallaii TaxID=48710 RepID=A0ABP1Q0J7_9HEXA